MATESVTAPIVDAADRADTLIHYMSAITDLMRSAAYSHDNANDESWGSCAALLGDMLGELSGHVQTIEKTAKGIAA